MSNRKLKRALAVVGEGEAARVWRRAATRARGWRFVEDASLAEAVVIATSGGAGHDRARAAVVAGRHVLTATPFIAGADALRELAIEADAAGVKLACSFPARCAGPVRDARRILAAWTVGPVRRLRVVCGEFGDDRADAATHACDLIRLFLGEVVAIDVEREEAPRLRLNSSEIAVFRDFLGVEARLEADRSRPRGATRLIVTGAAGDVEVELEARRQELSARLDDGTRIARHYASRRLEATISAAFAVERACRGELEALRGRLDGEPHAGASAWDGVRALELAESVVDPRRAPQFNRRVGTPRREFVATPGALAS